MDNDKIKGFLAIIFAIIGLAAAAFMIVAGVITEQDNIWRIGVDIILTALGWVGGMFFGSKQAEVKYMNKIFAMKNTTDTSKSTDSSANTDITDINAEGSKKSNAKSN